MGRQIQRFSEWMAPLLSAGPSGFFPQTHTHQSAKLKCILTTFSQKVKTTQLLHRPNKQTKTQTNTLSDRTHFGWYADSGRLTDKTPKWALSSTNVGQAFALGAQMLKMYKRLKWGNVCVALERFHHHHHHCVCLCVCVCVISTLTRRMQNRDIVAQNQPKVQEGEENWTVTVALTQIKTLKTRREGKAINNNNSSSSSFSRGCQNNRGLLKSVAKNQRQNLERFWEASTEREGKANSRLNNSCWTLLFQ